MPIRRYKPTSPGRRFMSVSTFEEITKKEPEKSLLESVTKKGGRNNNGRITTRHQGGGHKRRYRVIELKPGQGAKMARSAGSGVQLVAKDEGYGVLRLPSGEMRRVPLKCRATVGQVGNVDHQNITGGKAGRSRWRGKRPAVRGSAMNP